MILKLATLRPVTLAAALSISSAFADNSTISAPKGWIVTGSAQEQFVFGTEKCANTKCAFIKSKTDTPNGFGTLMQEISANQYIGKRLRLSALLETDRANHASLWMAHGCSGWREAGLLQL